MLAIQSLAKTYDTGEHEVLALTEIDLSVPDGEFVSLLGPSGCGKSTLLKIVAGLIPGSSGTVEIDGRNITSPGADRAVVFQDYALFPWMTVRGNVEFGLEARGMPVAQRNKISDKLLRVMHLHDFADKYPHHLSGGMKQRVSIARALAVEPSMLLMDEPFGALDAQTRSVLQDELLRIWDEFKKTVIFVTHSIDEAVYLSDRVVVMTARPGRIKEIRRIDQPRPRDLTSPEMSSIVREVRTTLKEEIGRSIELEEADMKAG